MGWTQACATLRRAVAAMPLPRNARRMLEAFEKARAGGEGRKRTQTV